MTKTADVQGDRLFKIAHVRARPLSPVKGQCIALLLEREDMKVQETSSRNPNSLSRPANRQSELRITLDMHFIAERLCIEAVNRL
jgi:hypothetical protein